MKIKKSINKKYIILFFVAIFFSLCSKEQVTPLPQEVVIDQISVNLAKRQVNFRGTQLYGDQVGEWKILSQNEVPGSFSDNFSFNTLFTGSIYEEYRIEWSINNGYGEVTKTLLFRISAGGYSIRELFKAESSFIKLLDFFDIDTILSSISIQEILDSGTSLNELLKVRTILQLFNSGVTINQFFDAGITLGEIVKEISILQLYKNGISIESLINAGITYKDLFDEISQGASFNYCYEKPLINSFVQEFLNLNISIKDLINSGISIYDLYFNGITLEQFIADKIPFKDVILNIPTISSLDFIELGLSSTILIKEGIIQETPTKGFYFMNYIHHPTGSSLVKEFNLLNNNISGMDSWRLPTIEELSYIFENKSSFDLKLNELFFDNPRICNEWNDRGNQKVWIGTYREQCWGGTGGPSPSYDALNFNTKEIIVYCSRYTNAYLLPVIKL